MNLALTKHVSRLTHTKPTKSRLCHKYLFIYYILVHIYRIHFETQMCHFVKCLACGKPNIDRSQM